MKTQTKILLGGAAIALLAIVLVSPRLSPVANIRSGHLGVITRAGAFIRTEQPGLRLKWPLLENLVLVSNRPQQRTFPVVDAYTAEGDAVGVRVAVLFRPNPERMSEAFDLYGRDLGRQLDLLLPEQVKTAMRSISTTGLLSDRHATVERLRDQIAKTSSTLLLVDSVLVESLNFSPAMQALAERYEEIRLRKLDLALVEQSERLQLALDEARLRRELAVKKQRDSANLASAVERAKILADHPGARDLLIIDQWNGGAPLLHLDRTSDRGHAVGTSRPPATQP